MATNLYLSRYGTQSKDTWSGPERKVGIVNCYFAKKTSHHLHRLRHGHKPRHVGDGVTKTGKIKNGWKETKSQR